LFNISLKVFTPLAFLTISGIFFPLAGEFLRLIPVPEHCTLDMPKGFASKFFQGMPALEENMLPSQAALPAVPRLLEAFLAPERTCCMPDPRREDGGG
jgi:hypothetical protein